MKSEDEKRFDVRLLDRNHRDGLLEPGQLDERLKGLEDLEGEADWMSYDEITSLRVGQLAARERTDDEADEDSGRLDDD